MTLQAKILIVDDEIQNQRLMRSVLQKHYVLDYASNGEEALLVTESFEPDLILMDIRMPKMDGYEACQQLKSNYKTHDIPVIFVSAYSDVQKETYGLEIGAIDYIQKPISIPTLLARVKNYLKLIENHQQITQHRDDLVFEQNLIEGIISRMRDSEYLDQSHIQTLEIPACKISGDLVLSAKRPDDGHHVILGDFTGHGIAAAVCAPMVSEIFYRMTHDGLNLNQIITEINERLFKDTPAYIFMATIAVEISPTRQDIKVWNCSAPDVLLYRENKLIRRFKSNYLARGVMLGEEQHPEQFSVQPDDLIYMGSDGIIESADSEGNMLGQSKLDSLLTELVINKSPLNIVKDSLQEFTGQSEFLDDITLVQIRC